MSSSFASGSSVAAQLALLLCVCLSSVCGYFITIDAHAEECFFDRVSSGTKLSLMFEVAEGGFLDIDVHVSPPRSPHPLRFCPLLIHSLSLLSTSRWDVWGTSIYYVKFGQF